MAPSTPGLLIALEGIDGSGTTSQLPQMEAAVKELGLPCHATAEPSTGPVGKTIRRILSGDEGASGPELALLFAADRLDHLDREILPALGKGAVVITDRYLMSSYAYQSTDVDLDWVQSINRHARKADLNLLLRVSAKTAEQRRAKRGGPDERFDAHERQRQVASRYDELAEGQSCGPTQIIDAEASLDAVTEAIRGALGDLLGRGGKAEV